MLLLAAAVLLLASLSSAVLLLLLLQFSLPVAVTSVRALANCWRALFEFELPGLCLMRLRAT